MSTVSIGTRRAVIDDAFAISATHEAAWRHAYTGMIPHKSLDTMVRRRDAKWWARAIRHSTRILVLESDNQIVGYATMGPNRVAALPQDGEVYELYLLPEYQGVGLGKTAVFGSAAGTPSNWPEKLCRLGVGRQSPGHQFLRECRWKACCGGKRNFQRQDRKQSGIRLEMTTIVE